MLITNEENQLVSEILTYITCFFLCALFISFLFSSSYVVDFFLSFKYLLYLEGKKLSIALFHTHTHTYTLETEWVRKESVEEINGDDCCTENIIIRSKMELYMQFLWKFSSSYMELIFSVNACVWNDHETHT